MRRGIRNPAGHQKIVYKYELLVVEEVSSCKQLHEIPAEWKRLPCNGVSSSGVFLFTYRGTKLQQRGSRFCSTQVSPGMATKFVVPGHDSVEVRI